jgi:type IV conjugative transfer system coupling protein TraD
MSEFSLLHGLALGLGAAGLFIGWRRAASRWNTWFPLLKKGLEYTLILVACILAIMSMSYILDALDANQGMMGLLVLLIGVVVPSVAFKYLNLLGNKEELKRGTNVVSSTSLAKQIKFKKKSSRFNISDVPFPYESEPYHLLVSGSTGTGKSVAINEMLEQFRKNEDTVIIVDSGGDFLAKHFKEDADFVFNPFDQRCVNWSPTLEMTGPWDADSLSRSIVPDGVGDNKEWNSYAQTFISCILERLYKEKRLSLKEFLYAVQIAPIKELKVFLEGTAAASQLTSEKTFGSIRTIASNYVNTYKYLSSDGPEFSITEMIKAEHAGFLYLTYRDDQLDSLRSLIGCILDVAARTILSLPPNPNRRVWLVLDEFASIGKIQSIEAVATKARKMGGCLLIGIQSIAQLKERYGENGAQTILSCLSSWLVLRCGDADTAEYMSKYIGDSEVIRHVKGQSSSDTGDSSSQNEQHSTQRAVMASELQSLPNLQGFLRLAGGFPVCSLKLTPPTSKTKLRTVAFEPKNYEEASLVDLTGVKLINMVEKPLLDQVKAPIAPPKASAPQKPSLQAKGDKIVKSAVSSPLQEYLKNASPATKILLQRAQKFNKEL